MKPPDWSRAHRIATRAEAAALDHPLRSRLLMACVRQERSLTELARDLGAPLAKLHYHLGPLLGCGLLTVSRAEPRAGRAVRYYRAVAESFLISLADMAEAPGAGLGRELRQSLDERSAGGNLSLLHYLDDHGRNEVRLIDPEESRLARRAFEYWKVIPLTREQRQSLAAEIDALIRRYETETAGQGGELFLVHAAFAPKVRKAPR
jgi:hypothetical protein